MIQIDLLKGEGLPCKSHPRRILVFGFFMLLPALAGISLMGQYLANKTSLHFLRVKLVSRGEIPPELAAIQQFLSNAQTEHKILDSNLSEVKKTLDYHMQWSPILVALVESLPEEVTIDSLELKRSQIRHKIPLKTNPSLTEEITLYQYTLQIVVHSDLGSEAIQKYLMQLRNSEALVSNIENIQLVSQKSVSKGEAVLIHYELECTFKIKNRPS